MCSALRISVDDTHSKYLLPTIYGWIAAASE